MAQWLLVIFVAVAALAYVAIVAVADFGDVGREILRLDAGTWLVVLALSLVNYGLRLGRWDAYLRGLGHRVPPVRQLLIYLTGFALTPTPGKIGEGIRALYLRPLGVGIGRTVSTLYAERLLDLMAISLLAALLCLAPLSQFRWLALVGGAIAVALLAAQHGAVLSLTLRLTERLPAGRVRGLARRLWACQRDVSALVGRKMLVLGLLAGLVAWAAEGLGFYLVADALGIEIGLLPAIGIYATAMLAGALSFVPGGIGSAEAAMVALLSLSGAPLPGAVAATLLIRLATLWFAVGLGGGAWLSLAVRRSVPAPTSPGRDAA